MSLASMVILILTEAVRGNPSAVRATDASFETEVQRCLRQACDRDGGRQHRYKKDLSGKGKGHGENSKTGPQTTSEQLASAAELSE